ncbi:MAG: RlmE family RNA methyltransferase [Pseudomonadota bacterium]
MADDGKRRWTGPGSGKSGSGQNGSGKRGSGKSGTPKDAEKKGSGRRMGERKVIARNAKSESSKRWIERQLTDPYVQKAKSAGFRARAAFKLLEIDEKFRLLKPGQRVVDLGCAPGGWLQVAQQKGAAEIVGIDLLPVERLAGVHIIEGDVNEPADVAQMLEGLTGPPDLVLSDMASNTTGHKQTDHLRTIALVEMALGFAIDHLAPGGAFASKVFQGGATRDILEPLKANFADVKHLKPPSSRAGSPEIFVIAKGFRGQR